MMKSRVFMLAVAALGLTLAFAWSSRAFAQTLAATNHWKVVDMKRDWKVIFPFQKQ